MQTIALVITLILVTTLGAHGSQSREANNRPTIHLGVVGSTPVNMGEYPKIGGVVSVEAAHFETSVSALTAYKVGAVGGPGVSVTVSGQGWYRFASAGARYSLLAVRDYHKQAVRPFVAVGRRDLNVKYIHFGADRLNRVQAVYVDWRRQINSRWRFGVEAGPNFYHATNNPAKRHFGGTMAFRFERRMGR